MRVPAWVKLALIPLIPLVACSYLVWRSTYDTAMDELQDHEEVDLRQEVQLYCKSISNNIENLKIDALTLASDPVVHHVMQEVYDWQQQMQESQPAADSEQSNGTEENESTEKSNDTQKVKADREALNSVLDARFGAHELTYRKYLRQKIDSLIRLDINESSVESIPCGKWEPENQNDRSQHRAQSTKTSLIKPYFQMRLIDAGGREIYRMGMEYDLNKPTSRVELVESTIPRDESSNAYMDTVKIFHEKFDETGVADKSKNTPDSFSNVELPKLIRPYLTRFELNRQDGHIQLNRPTVRCWVPIVSEGGDAFLGIAIINFDFTRLARYISFSPRHLVYMTNEKGQFLIHPDANREFLFSRAPATAQDSNAMTDFRLNETQWGERYDINLPDTVSQTSISKTFNNQFEDKGVTLPNGQQERELEFSGWKIAELNDGFRFDEEKPKENDSFSLIKFARPDDIALREHWYAFESFMLDAIHAFHAGRLSDFKSLDRIRSNVAASSQMNHSFHVSARVSKDKLLPGIRELIKFRLAKLQSGDLEEKINSDLDNQLTHHQLKLIEELPDKLSQFQKYDPVRCETFAAYFFRIYLDPGTPALVDGSDDLNNGNSDSSSGDEAEDHASDRYLTFLMAFSKEELGADLAKTNKETLKYATVFLVAFSLLALGLAYISTRRLKKLTVVANKLADGQENLTLPSTTVVKDEISDLVLAFERMSEQVNRRQMQLEAQRSRLNDMVQHRTRHLTETLEELSAAKVELEGLNEAKDVFLASVSHELRNPLNAVMGFCQLLEMSELNDQQADDVDKISANAKRLLSLINDILDYQKIIMGGVSLEPEHTELDELLNELEDGLRHQADENKNNLIVNRVGPDKSIYADHRRLLQVLINIAGNACKFTRKGTVRVASRFFEKHDLHGWEFVVSDNGPGMSDEVKSKLYTPFSRAKISQGGGTGLGLVICKGFVELMGGTISVESREGRGTRFTIRLPATEQDKTEAFQVLGDELAQRAGSDLDSRSSMFRTDHDNRKVLVVEDDADSLEFIRRTVEADDWEVIEAANGVEALNILEEEQPAAIVLDLLMPVMDGVEFLSKYIEKAEIQRIPVIVLTAMETSARDDDFLSKNAVRVLKKGTFTQDELLTELKYQVTESGTYRP